MQGTRDIKRRMRSVQNTKQITKAMEMVAAAKLRRAEQRAQMNRPYAEKLREVIQRIAQSTSTTAHPMLQAREVKRTAYLIITSDRGLAGGYNGNLLRDLVKVVRERHAAPEEYGIYVIGRKGRDFLQKRNHPIFDSVLGLSDYPEFADIKSIATHVVEGFADGEFDEVILCYNEYISAIQQTPVQKQLLPLIGLASVDVDEQAEKRASYNYEPSAEEVLSALLPQYAESLIYSAVLEAKASEQGARMTAMGNATDNAGEMIETLNLQYNRARQAAITQEIAEIVGGANALS